MIGGDPYSAYSGISKQIQSSAFKEKALDAGISVIQDAIGSREGHSKPNRYEIELFFPINVFSAFIDEQSAGKDDPLQKVVKWASVGGNDTQRKMAYRCDEISLPGRNIRTVPTMALDYGPSREIAQGVTFGEMTMSFYGSSDLRERRILEIWQEKIYEYETDYSINYYNDYIGDINIFMLNEQNERTYQVSLKECYPKTINEIQIGHGQNNAITKVTASFVYREWTSENNLSASFMERLGNSAAVVGTDLGASLVQKSLPRVFNL